MREKFRFIRLLHTGMTQALVLVVLASPAMAVSNFFGSDGAGLHAQCFSLGASIGRVDELGDDLSSLAGPDNGAIILEGTQNNYLTPYTSEEIQLTLFLIHKLNLVQGSYGWRWSTVPFPKVLLRPWVGAYVTLSALDDRSDVDPQEEEESNGIGFGVAAAAGITLKLNKSLALEAAFRGDQIFTTGWLDTGDFFKDEFRIRGAYLRFLYFLKE